MRYYVRPMRREDLAEIARIDREAFSTQWPPADYAHELKNQLAHYLVACTRTPEEPARPRSPSLFTRVRCWLGVPPRTETAASESEYAVGFAGIWLLADEAHITNIAVRKSYQRRGIGELLLISIVELAQQLNARIITLEVRVSNAPAQNLYRKYGCAEVGLRRGYYTDNREDGLLMSTESITSTAFMVRFGELKQNHLRKLKLADCWSVA
ncbi:MAG: ribosomal protein S18-alanine N-acetyltransferase [Chloroflexi bacterium]|nr:ribosomal protein S18-alanine N-acetyltransferase [Chloroflexota bacterium]